MQATAATFVDSKISRDDIDGDTLQRCDAFANLVPFFQMFTNIGWARILLVLVLYTRLVLISTA